MLRWFRGHSHWITAFDLSHRMLKRARRRLRSPRVTHVSADLTRLPYPDAFFDTVTRAAQQAGHPLRELRRTGHALDHPITFPEGAYLKCLFASVPA